MSKPPLSGPYRPRCIAPFASVPSATIGVVLDGHPSSDDLKSGLPPEIAAKINAPAIDNAIYSLRCSCGCELHTVHGFRWRNPDFDNDEVFLSPVELQCSSCQKRSPVFDSDQHGYDAELGHGSAAVRAEGEPGQAVCKSCGAADMRLTARFELPEDLFDGSFKAFAGRENDLFTWFTLAGTCHACGTEDVVFDCECA